MKYFIRTGEEFRESAEKLIEWGQPLPNPLLPVYGFTAEEDGIKGLAVVQCLPFIEPFHVDEGHRKSNIGLNLFQTVHDFLKENKIPRAFMHSERPSMQKLLRKSQGVKDTDQIFFEYRTEWL